jgi:hypothetical protein
MEAVTINGPEQCALIVVSMVLLFGAELLLGSKMQSSQKSRGVGPSAVSKGRAP